MLGDARDLDVAIERLNGAPGRHAPDERPGIEGLVARYREERAAEDPLIAALFARIDETGLRGGPGRYVASTRASASRG